MKLFLRFAVVASSAATATQAMQAVTTATDAANTETLAATGAMAATTAVSASTPTPRHYPPCTRARRDLCTEGPSRAHRHRPHPTAAERPRHTP